MRDLSTRIEQSFHPHPVLNTELNIDHNFNAAFRIEEKMNNQKQIALI